MNECKLLGVTHVFFSSWRLSTSQVFSGITQVVNTKDTRLEVAAGKLRRCEDSAVSTEVKHCVA